MGKEVEARKLSGGTKKKRVLFLYTHNSCRSQMAEGLLRHYGGDCYEVFSARTSPSRVYPMAVEVMAERGIDMTGQRSKSVEEFTRNGFDFIVTTCEDARDSAQSFRVGDSGSIEILKIPQKQEVQRRREERFSEGLGMNWKN